jgi:hypothetical protein
VREFPFATNRFYSDKRQREISGVEAILKIFKEGGVFGRISPREVQRFNEPDRLPFHFKDNLEKVDTEITL